MFDVVKLLRPQTWYSPILNYYLLRSSNTPPPFRVCLDLDLAQGSCRRRKHLGERRTGVGRGTWKASGSAEFLVPQVHQSRNSFQLSRPLPSSLELPGKPGLVLSFENGVRRETNTRIIGSGHLDVMKCWSGSVDHTKTILYHCTFFFTVHSYCGFQEVWTWVGPTRSQTGSQIRFLWS